MARDTTIRLDYAYTPPYAAATGKHHCAELFLTAASTDALKLSFQSQVSVQPVGWNANPTNRKTCWIACEALSGFKSKQHFWDMAAGNPSFCACAAQLQPGFCRLLSRAINPSSPVVRTVQLENPHRSPLLHIQQMHRTSLSPLLVWLTRSLSENS